LTYTLNTILVSSFSAGLQTVQFVIDNQAKSDESDDQSQRSDQQK
jgi:hypothetical protein